MAKIDNASEKELVNGLSSWVENFKSYRKLGNIKKAKKIRNNINAIIAKKNLDKKIIYGDDPDKKVS